MPGATENRVEGYDVVRPEYDGPYLDGADFDPAEDFKFAGDPKKSAEHNQKRAKARKERREARNAAVKRRRQEREDSLVATSENPAEVSNASPDTQGPAAEKVPAKPETTQDNKPNPNTQVAKKTAAAKKATSSSRK